MCVRTRRVMPRDSCPSCDGVFHVTSCHDLDVILMSRSSLSNLSSSFIFNDMTNSHIKKNGTEKKRHLCSHLHNF